MPPFVLTVLKIVFLALLYFFVYRAVRSVVVDIRGARPVRTAADVRSGAGGGRSRKPAGGKPPRTIAILDASGSSRPGDEYGQCVLAARSGERVDDGGTRVLVRVPDEDPHRG